ncbi:MAG: RNA helicase, partial [Gammaproteobacteria bacterium]|nr:RNA helicase [Gammaproteobacteria bacterium]
EADRMLDMGFIPDIKRILALLPHNDDRQNLLFSATFSGEIKELADRLLQQPEKIQVAHENKTAELIEQVVHPVEKARKRELLSHMIGSRNWRQVLVFARTRHGADRLARHLDRDGLKSAALHGDKSQGQRTRALADFKAGRVRVLVATDIAARGLDIDQLPHVVNFELPNVPEDYVHRNGRTGRAGRGGEATSLVCPEEYKLLRDIERLLKRSVPISVLEEYAPAQPYRAEGPRPAGNGRGRGRPNGGNSRGRSNARGGNGNGKANGGDRARSASSHRGQGGQGDKGSQGSQGSHRGQGGGHGGGGQTERNGNVASKRVAEVRPEINGNVATPQNARPAGKPSHKPAGNRARRKAGDGQQAGQHRQSRPGQGRKSGNSRAAFRD